VHRLLTRVVCAALVLLLVALATNVIGGNAAPAGSRDTSSVFAAPDATPTYFSEVGPASVRPPHLPTTGTGAGTSLPWAPVAGVALGLLGAALIHAGLSSRKPCS
jgi:hypothetical protein